MKVKGYNKSFTGEILNVTSVTVDDWLAKGLLRGYKSEFLKVEQVDVDSIKQYIQREVQETEDTSAKSSFIFLSEYSSYLNLEIIDSVAQRLSYDLTVFNLLKDGLVLDLGDLDFAKLDEFGRYVCKEDISYEDFLVKLAELIDSLEEDREDLRLGVYWVR